ncbi:MAG: type II CAAX endopeptidase family protein [Terriglobales bacterium]
MAIMRGVVDGIHNALVGLPSGRQIVVCLDLPKMKTHQQFGHQGLIAPGWHLVAVLFTLTLFSVTGPYLAALAFALNYTIMMTRKVMLVGVILFVAAPSGYLRLRDLLGSVPATWTAAVRDVCIGIAVASLWWKGWDYVAVVVKPEAIRVAEIPHSKAAVIAYLISGCIVAPICEELVIRGYLQRQFAAVTHSRIAAVVLQAIVWGAAHGAYSFRSMLMIALFGIPFGCLALWRHSLIPEMIGHCAWNAFVLISWHA